MCDYLEFIKNKNKPIFENGIEITEDDLNPLLFDYQKALVVWALKGKRRLLGEECGMGKTFQQLEG